MPECGGFQKRSVCGEGNLEVYANQENFEPPGGISWRNSKLQSQQEGEDAEAAREEKGGAPQKMREY